MRKNDSETAAAERLAAGIKPTASKGLYARDSKIHVIECDAYELPELWERFDELVPKHNQHHREYGVFRFNPSWTGSIKSWEDAKSILQNGWPEGAESARKLADGMLPLLPPPESLRRKVRWSDDGGELDRDKLYASGIETAFRSTKQSLQRSPRTVKIVGTWGGNCSYSAEQLAWSGAAITALVDLLEQADFRVELTMGKVNTHHDHYTVSAVRTKAANEPMNISTVAAVAGHAGLYRTYGFCSILTSKYEVHDGLGMPSDVGNIWKKGVEAGVLDHADAFVNLASDERGAYARVTEVLKALLPDDQELHERLKTLHEERMKMGKA